MGKMGGFTAADLKKLQKQLNKIQEGNVEAFVDSCAKELAARLGSSPLTRGILVPGILKSADIRFIPAHAWNTPARC